MTLRYGPGDVVEVEGIAGTGTVMRVRVEEHEPDVKNGRPGGYGRPLDPESDAWSGKPYYGGVWWYDEQVLRVVRED